MASSPPEISTSDDPRPQGWWRRLQLKLGLKKHPAADNASTDRKTAGGERRSAEPKKKKQKGNPNIYPLY